MSTDACVNDEMLDEAAGVEFVEGSQPKVSLIDFPWESSGLLATVVRGYAQDYRPDITSAEVKKYLGELQKTKLKTPLSFLNTVWLIEDVTRAWANQMVRYRAGTSFVQESLRFSVHQRTRVLVPSTLLGQAGALADYKAGAREAVRSYRAAMALGGAVQDARGLLPLNTLTKMFASINMQTLCHIYEQRQCCQAQNEEWTPVLDAMRREVEELEPKIASFMEAPWQNPNCVTCGFQADFDRPCHRQAMFDFNLSRLAAQRQAELGNSPSEA